MRTLRTLALSLTFVLLLTSAAFAHSPIFLRPGEALAPIGDAEKSWAIYGRLAPGRAADQIPVDARAGQRLKLQLLVPKREDLKEFHPVIYLLGPGLTGALPSGAPVAPGTGDGALVPERVAAPTEFYEPFTQTRYWTYEEVTGTFPATGRYRVVVYDPSGKGGPYVAALGEREEFGAGDLLKFPAIWRRVRDWFSR